MKINWKVRIANINFWLTFVPAVLLLIQVVARLFGYELDLGDLGNKLKELINTVFLLLGILGIVNDPTTATMSDSANALTYEKPKK